MAVADTIALRSACSRAKIGAVIVDATNRIVATGYNGPPAGFRREWRDECDGSENLGFCLRGKYGAKPDTVTSYTDCPSLHAEANALSFCDRRHRDGGSIFVTGTTCINCAKLIANSGLARLVVRHDPAYDYRDPGVAYEFLQGCGITIVTIDA